MAQTRRAMTAEDLYNIHFVSDPQLSPQGDRVAYVETIIDEQQNYRSHLYLKSIGEGTTIPFTNGKVRDSYPRWSPDGKQLCFVSNRSGKSQLWLISTEGGEAKQLTNCQYGAREPFWSPDGKSILFSAWLEPGASMLDQHKQQKEEANGKSAVVVNRLKYKSDDMGFVLDKTKHLALVNVQTGEVTPLTEGSFDHTPGGWSPDGQWISITANRSENPELTHISDVYLISRQTGEWKKVTASDGNYFNPTWSADGKKLAYIGSKSENPYSTLKRVWVYDLQSGEESCITADWDVHVADVAIGDMRSGGHPNPGAVWSPEENGVYFLASSHGDTSLFFATLDGQIKPVISGKRHLYGFTMNKKRTAAVVAVSDPTNPGELYAVDLTTGEEQQLTSANNELLSELDLSVPEEFEYQAQDGWKIQGWMMKPVGYEAGKKYPLILQIHGGPHAMYGHTFFHEFQILTAKGYAVLFTNPRGSHGYGQTFVKAVCGDYGGSDYTDLMSGVDYALSRYDFIDETRLGVTGGSYGGFMTNWIVGHTNRFKAAVTDRCISNWLSFYGVSDIGYTFSVEQIHGNMYENPEKLWQHSPIRFASNIETPLLIMHGETDYRCPVEQAEQLYVTLKRQGKAPVSLIRFPDSTHELSRSGDPKLRTQRLNYMADWFAKYL